MTETPRYVSDASVVLMALFKEQQGGQEASDFLVDFVTGRIRLSSPFQIAYETAAVIRRKVLQQELSLQLGLETLNDFLALRIPHEHPEGLVFTSYDFALRYGLTLYDALYVALAHILQATLLTGDEALLRALTGRLPRVFSIEDYVPAR